MRQILNEEEKKKITINSDIFSGMLLKVDEEIKRVLTKVYSKEFASGDVNIKISIEIPEFYKEEPKLVDKDTGEVINKSVLYKNPEFEYKVSSTLKQKYEHKGEYKEIVEIVEVDGDYIIKELDDPQINMFGGLD